MAKKLNKLLARIEALEKSIAKLFAGKPARKKAKAAKKVKKASKAKKAKKTTRKIAARVSRKTAPKPVRVKREAVRRAPRKKAATASQLAAAALEPPLMM